MVATQERRNQIVTSFHRSCGGTHILKIRKGGFYDEIIAHVNAGLQKKGFVLERGVPQFLIVVYLGLKEQVTTTDKGGENYGKGKLKVEIEVHPEGAVYMDIIDAQTFDLIWRGTATKETEDEPTEETMEKNMRKALDKLIDGFPPKS